MFRFVIKYFGFLKFVPGLPLLFDAWLKLWTFINHPALLDWMDEIEVEMTRLSGVQIHTHKYGGLQFDYGRKELGHIHGNGLLDMPLSLKLKNELMLEGGIEDHHSFKDTGWISFYIRTENDRNYAVKLLRWNYDRIKAVQIPSRHAEFISASHRTGIEDMQID